MSTPTQRTGWSRATELLHSLFFEDHCEWINRYVYWLKSPLGVLGLSAVASLLLGLFVAPQGYVLLAAILAVIVTGLAWPKLGIRGLDCDVRFETPRACEGKPTPVEVRITNRWPFPVWGLVIEDGFFDAAPGEDSSAVALARIGGWAQTTFRWDFTPEQRGRYPKQTPSLATAFPFGLWKARKAVRMAGSIVAWPKTFWLPPYPAAEGRQAWSGETSDAYAGNEGERIGVRDHRHGDSLRLVNWAKTARHDRLIVSERQGASTQRASLRVDTDPASHTGSGPASSLEWAIRITASVAETLLAQGTFLEVRLGDECVGFMPSPSESTKLMDWLAECGPSGEGSATAASRVGRDGVPRSGRMMEGPRTSTRLSIGTTRSKPEGGGAAILLDAGAFSENGKTATSTTESSTDTPTASPTKAGSWILVDEPDQVSDQVLRGWRRSPQEACRGA